jgi:hypothetical protein
VVFIRSGFTHALIVRLRDRADLSVYAAHPAHQEFVAAFLKPETHITLKDDVLAFDWEATPVKATCPPMFKYALPAMALVAAVGATWMIARRK